MTTTLKSFLDYGEDDGTVVYYAALTSASDLGGATIGGGGTPTYDANDGISLGAANGLNIIPAISAAQLEEIKKEFTITAWVEKEFFTDLGAAALFLFGFTFNGLVQVSGGYPKLTNGGTSSAQGKVGASSGASHLRVDLSYEYGRMIVYVDKYPVIGLDGKEIAASTWSGGFLGIGAIASLNSTNKRVKNCTLRNRAVRFAIPAELSKLVGFGSSYMNGSGYANHYSTDLQYITRGSIPEYGSYSYSGNDETAFASLHRTLNTAGVDVGHRQISNFGQSGGVAAGYSIPLGQALANGQHYSAAMIWYGANETFGGGIPFDTVAPNFQSDMQALVDALIGAGVKIILIGNQYTLQGHPDISKTNATFAANETRCNELLAAVVAANSECHLVDFYSSFGTDRSLVGNASEDIHPSIKGHKYVGELWANKLLEVIGRV